MLVVVGRIGRAHGIRGEVAVDVRTDEPERRFSRGSTLTTDSRTLTVTSSRWHSGRLLVVFEEIVDRTAAEALRGAVLEAQVDPHERPADDGEYYDRQLIGLEARDEAGRVVGRISGVVHHDEQDTLVVAAGDREILVPFVAAIVPTVDLDGGHLTVVDVPGLLSPLEAD